MIANYPITLTYVTLFILLLSHSNHASSCFKHIIGFGDSLADTGNLLHLPEPDHPLFFELPPYGDTFFHHPTGRCSDGRLVIDFIAEYLGLPLVPPFYDGQNSSRRGSVNFAVAGATALPDSFFLSKGIAVLHANTSLGDQLTWFTKLFLPKFYHKPSDPDRKEYMESSLVIVGEIGGNDYNHPLLDGKSIEEIQTFVPPVVNAIASAIKEVIKAGAIWIMVPGNLPIGCSATYLNIFKTSNKTDYDPKTGCLLWLNKFARYHNKMLRIEVGRIQMQNPNTTIIYADYYNAAMRFYRSPDKYGFAEGAIATCCPTCGPYKVDGASKVCDDPSEYVNWDGLHLTEAAYKVIATGLVAGYYTTPPFQYVCDMSPLQQI